MSRRVMKAAAAAAASMALVSGALAPSVGAAESPSPEPTTLQSVVFVQWACPTGTTLASIKASGGAREICAIAGRTGDFPAPADGYSWRFEPVEYNQQITLDAGGSTLTDPEPMAGGMCDSVTKICTAYQAYGWTSVPTGDLLLKVHATPNGWWLSAIATTIDGNACNYVGGSVGSSGEVGITTTADDASSNVVIDLIYTPGSDEGSPTPVPVSPSPSVDPSPSASAESPSPSASSTTAAASDMSTPPPTSTEATSAGQGGPARAASLVAILAAGIVAAGATLAPRRRRR
jgi:hypothetical protein